MTAYAHWPAFAVKGILICRAAGYGPASRSGAALISIRLNPATAELGAVVWRCSSRGGPATCPDGYG